MAKYTEDQVKLQKLIAERSSTRNFLAEPVPDAVVTDLLRVTMRAPTAYNVQPYKIILARKQEDRDRLAESMFGFNTDKVKEAPLIAVFLADLEPHKLVPRTQEVMTKSGYPAAFVDSLPAAVYESAGDGPLAGQPRVSKIPTIAWSFKNATFPAMTFMYAAEAFGLSTVAIEGYDEEKAKQVLGVPDRFAIPVMIVCGYKAPENEHPPNLRFDVDEVVYEGKFGVTNDIYSNKQ